MPLRIMLDSNVYDEIVAMNGFSLLLEEAEKCGQIAILRTHIQNDELSGIRSECKREAAAKVPGGKIPTSAAIWGVSKWGESSWGDGAGDLKVGDVQKGNPKHSEDALIAVTAASHADVLVTEDISFASRIKASGSKLRVWNFQELRQYIEALQMG